MTRRVAPVFARRIPVIARFELFQDTVAAGRISGAHAGITKLAGGTFGEARLAAFFCTVLHSISTA